MKYSIWFSEAMGAGNPHAKTALQTFGSAQAVYEAQNEGRERSGVFTAGELSRLRRVTLKDAEQIERDCAKNGISLFPFGSPRYPYCLSVIENPPVLLYVKGNLPEFDSVPAICIVGPRSISPYGKRAAYSLGYRLAKSGLTVVSGGAVGGDYYAHLGALKAGGVTVLVMGCGILSRYLPENRKLREAVSRDGCLVSELSPRTNASKYSFLIRNRILSALALGTVVVESGQKSGTLNTANHAVEQGRDVFVIPGSPGQPQYAGSNALLRDGAKPLLNLSDIFNEYLPRFPDKIDVKRAFEKNTNPQKESVHKKLSNETLSNKAKIVYNHIRGKTFYPEEIADTGLSSDEILTALTELEFEMLIRAIPGGRYEIVR